MHSISLFSVRSKKISAKQMDRILVIYKAVVILKMNDNKRYNDFVLNEFAY